MDVQKLCESLEVKEEDFQQFSQIDLMAINGWAFVS
jgi:uncharacterized protein YbcC (UPF0753/DUF2309 family)